MCIIFLKKNASSFAFSAKTNTAVVITTPDATLSKVPLHFALIQIMILLLHTLACARVQQMGKGLQSTCAVSFWGVREFELSNAGFMCVWVYCQPAVSEIHKYSKIACHPIPYVSLQYRLPEQQGRQIDTFGDNTFLQNYVISRKKNPPLPFPK